jgi:chorismate mutase
MTTNDLSKDPLIIDLRKSIDYMDISFINLLTERMRAVRKIIFLKDKKHLDLVRSDARKQDMRELIEMSVQLKLESSFFQNILDLVFEDALTQYSHDEDHKGMDIVCEGLNLDQLRLTLLNLDKSLCLVLAERFKIVKRIGIYKHNLGIPPLDKVRWKQVLDHKVVIAKSVGVSADLIKDIFNAIHEVALSIEDQMMND